MSIHPDYRNQYTTLDAERAKNTVHATCERCGCGISRNAGRTAKRFCGPCSSERMEEINRLKGKERCERLRAKSDAPRAYKVMDCADCGEEIRVFGTRKRCHSCEFKVKTARGRIRAARAKGTSFRLTDLEIPQAQELRQLGFRTDEIAEMMELPEAAVANSLWAEKFGDHA